MVTQNCSRGPGQSVAAVKCVQKVGVSPSMLMIPPMNTRASTMAKTGPLNRAA